MTTSSARSEPADRGRRRSLNGLAIQLSAVALSFILVSLLVVTSSRAAFTAQTGNANNQVASANIQLTDNDGGSATANAMFNVTNAIPGQTYDRCITVTYTGSANFTPTGVRLYSNQAPSGTLAQYLNLTVEVGPAVSAAFSGSDATGCAGFTSATTVYSATAPTASSGTLSNFISTRTNYTNGVSTSWNPANSGDARSFRFRITVKDDDNAKGLSATPFGFQWETQSS